MNKWRRFEVLLPLKFNDGTPIPRSWFGQATREIVELFGAASVEPQTIEGHWIQSGILYRDKLFRIFVDVPDLAKNRRSMKEFKARWKSRTEQLEIWMVSYRIEIE